MTLVNNEDTSNQAKKELKSFFLGYPARQYKRHEVVLGADQPPPGVFYIEEGHIKIVSITSTGEERIHIIYKSGEVFPTAWIFSGKLAGADYIAMDGLKVRICPQEEFLNLCYNSTIIMRKMIDQLILAYDRVMNLNQENAYLRVLHRLLTLANRFGERVDGHVMVKLPLTQKELAASVNLSREMTSKILQQLEAKGLVEIKNRRLLVSKEDVSSAMERYTKSQA